MDRPRLVKGINDCGKPAYLRDGNLGRYHSCTQLLASALQASTWAEQKTSLEDLIIGTFSDMYGMRIGRKDRAIFRARGLDIARLVLDESGQANLAFVGIPFTGSLDYTQISPTFVVLQSYHGDRYVVRNPEDPLPDNAKDVSNEFAGLVAADLNSQFPGFELYEKLKEAGFEKV